MHYGNSCQFNIVWVKAVKWTLHVLIMAWENIFRLRKCLKECDLNQLNSKDTWEDRSPWSCLLSVQMRQGSLSDWGIAQPLSADTHTWASAATQGLDQLWGRNLSIWTLLRGAHLTALRLELGQCPEFVGHVWMSGFLGGGVGYRDRSRGNGQIYLSAASSKKTLNQCRTPLCDCCIQMQQSFVLNVVRNRLSLWAFLIHFNLWGWLDLGLLVSVMSKVLKTENIRTQKNSCVWCPWESIQPLLSKRWLTDLSQLVTDEGLSAISGAQKSVDGLCCSSSLPSVVQLSEVKHSA